MDGAVVLQVFFIAVFLISNVYSLEISIEGSKIAGNELNIICTVMLQADDAETDVVSISLEKQDSEAGSGGALVSSDDNLAVVLTFSSLTYSDGGLYVCSAQLVNDSTSADELLVAEYNLTVEFPLPLVQTVAIPQRQIFVGENVTIRCEVEVDTTFNISHSIIATWLKSGTAIGTGLEELNRQERTARYVFELEDQLVQNDLVCYSCNVSIMPAANDPFVTGVNYADTVTLSAIDPPDLIIGHVGTQTIGSHYLLNCSCSHNDKEGCNSFPVSLMWYKYEDTGQFVETDELPNHNLSYAILYFDTLSFDDAGLYTCKAVLNNRLIATAETPLLYTTPFNVTVKHSTPFYIVISWSRPLSSMVSPDNYSIATNISERHRITVQANTTSFNVTGLHPHQYVEITIKANSNTQQDIGGEDPISGSNDLVSGRDDSVSIVFLTREFVPGEVESVNITVINRTSVLVHWEPVPPGEANGVIIGYQLTVFKENNLTMEEVYSRILSNRDAIITGLAAETRYILTVRAVNSLYNGTISSHVFYTAERVLPPPMDIKVDINRTHLSVTWTPVNDPRGVVWGYSVGTADNIEGLLTVRTNFASLEVADMYAFRVSTINGEGVRGHWSHWITNAESAIIQMRGGPFKSCLEWTKQDKNSIILLFKQSLANFSHAHCNCSSVVYTHSNDTLSCDNSTPTYAIYRTSITGIHPYTTNLLVDLISQWIMGGATITSGITQITLDPQCPVVIATVNESYCASEIQNGGSQEESPPSLTVLLTSLLSTTVMLICFMITIVVCTWAVWRANRIHTWRFLPCPTPEGHPWTYQQGQFPDVMFTNASIEDFEAADDEEVETNSGEGMETNSGEREGSLSRGGEERESGVYDASNLTVIYESDHESTKL